MSGAHPDDEHVRALLDQRAQRADVPPPHARFSIFSDRSDSPSLYSHFDNNYRNTPTTPVPNFPRFYDNNVYNDRHDNYPPLSPKERLADPNASSLDLSEDTDSYSESGSRTADPEDDSNLNPGSDEDPETRLSLMGPKMRVHSRAPWEEEDGGSYSDDDLEDGGNDNLSVFGGKKSGRAVMRGLGFGSKSPAPRPSFDSSTPSKGKRSFETTSSIALSSTSQSVIHTLAQASMSSTSLAIGPSPSSSRLPHKLSMGRIALNRGRSASGPGSANTSDKSSNYPPIPSPHPTAYMEHSSGRQSPASSISPQRSELTVSAAHSRSPSPNADGDGPYIHPYANPAHASAYHREPLANPFSKDESEVESGHSHIARNDSVATLATSEETVMLSQSSSAASASVASTSGVFSSTPPTSDFSLVSSTSMKEPRLDESLHELERMKQQRRTRRETKLGPISAPSMVGNSDFTATTPYNLISLEQAQARAKERNRSATTGAVAFPVGPQEGQGAMHDIAMRARSSSATAGTKGNNVLPLLNVDSNWTGANDVSVPLSPINSNQPSPVGPPNGKVIRPKRSGFMKLFNGRDKDKLAEIPPLPVASVPDQYRLAQSNHAYPLPTAPPIKVSTHRVPVPAMPSSPPNQVENKDDVRSKKEKVGPSLSIKVSSPPTSHLIKQEPRRSDSPKYLHPSVSPKMPSSAPADMTQFPALRLRPVSSFFSNNNFAEHLLTQDRSPGSPKFTDASSLISPTTIASSSDLIPSPVNAHFNIGNVTDAGQGYSANRFSTATSGEDDDQAAIIAALKEQIRTSRIAWQRQIWELEGQVRDLRAEIEDISSGDICDTCGRGGPLKSEKKDSNAGVIHRPRAKTGYGARFASGNES